MAKKEKTSFFGKIMGGSVTDEMPQPVAVSHAPVAEMQADEELSVDDAAEEQAVSYEEEQIVETPKQPAKEGEEWLNDFEGQLNIDMYQTKDNVIIKSTIAGVSDKDLDISVTNDMVTIKGARTPEQKVRSSDYYYQELYWGAFSRSIILPVEVDADNAKASMKNGILTIRLPKLDKIRTKKIRIS